jgi:hypothetical protein
MVTAFEKQAERRPASDRLRVSLDAEATSIPPLNRSAHVATPRVPDHAPIPVPAKVVWREFRIRVLPLIIFFLALAAVVWLWL